MGDKAKIVAGLVIFLVLATFPIWYAIVAGEGAPPPQRQKPTDEHHCIETNMVAKHMDILNRWRDEVIREGVTEKYQSKTYPDDPPHLRSLTKTCMSCHDITRNVKHEAGDGGHSAVSCSECHEYANVEPTCWDCHLELKGNSSDE